MTCNQLAIAFWSENCARKRYLVWFSWWNKRKKTSIQINHILLRKNKQRVGEEVACNLNKFCLICFKFKSIEPKNKFFSSLRRENEIKAHTRKVSLNQFFCLLRAAFIASRFYTCTIKINTRKTHRMAEINLMILLFY